MTKLQAIAKKHGMILHQVVAGDKWCKANGEDQYINDSYFAGNEIWLGIYKDEKLKAMSFFHELGHRRIGQRFKKKHEYDAVMIEAEAWIQGCKLAKKYGYDFSEARYVARCLQSHRHSNMADARTVKLHAGERNG